jgi:hypothetical protein
MAGPQDETMAESIGMITPLRRPTQDQVARVWLLAYVGLATQCQPWLMTDRCRAGVLQPQPRRRGVPKRHLIMVQHHPPTSLFSFDLGITAFPPQQF